MNQFIAIVFVGIFAIGYSTDFDGEKRSYRGDKVIGLANEDFNNVLKWAVADEEIEWWGRNSTHSQIYFPKKKGEKALEDLKKSDVEFELIMDDVQNAIDIENPETDGAQMRNILTKGHPMDWFSYHSLGDIYAYMGYIARTYPKIATIGSVGKTTEWRDIKYLKISSGAKNPKIFWVDGGIHSREWLSPAAASYVIHELVENRGKYMEIVKDIDFYVMPVVNPDGYEYTRSRERMWRKNRSRHPNGCIGADLNRNWGYHWGKKGVSHNPCDHQIYAGSGPFSEPETRAISQFIMSIKQNLKASVSFHTFGQYILIPYSYDETSKPDDFEELERVGYKIQAAMYAIAGEKYVVGHTTQLLGFASGGSHDWVKGVAGAKYAYTFELRPNNYALGMGGFALPANLIIVASEEALAGVLAVATEL